VECCATVCSLVCPNISASNKAGQRICAHVWEYYTWKKHVLEETFDTLKIKLTPPWPESATKLYQPSDCRLSAKLVPTFADRGCHMVSVTDPYGRILGFLDRSRYYFSQVAPQLYSWGWVDPVPDSLLRSSESGRGGPTLKILVCNIVNSLPVGWSAIVLELPTTNPTKFLF
jgi:hypothetical protein